MAVIGSADIIVRAVTRDVSRDIQRGFRGAPSQGRKIGDTFGKAFSRGFNQPGLTSSFDKLRAGIKSAQPGADAARAAFQRLNRTGVVLGTSIAVILSGVFSLIGGLGALVGSAGGAAASIAVLGGVFSGFALALISARLALSGVGRALGLLNRQNAGGGAAAGPSPAAIAAAAAAREAAARRVAEAERALARVIERNREDLIDANNDVRQSQLDLNAALREGREELQQLGFSAEEAALAEGRAAIELERARETLARVQDLPPNSRIRREAELAFQEAELNLRQARDRATDLGAEQDRLARTGVAGTQVVIDATNALARAEQDRARTVRDGLRDEASAQEDIADARRNALTAGQGDAGGAAGGGGADPFAGLNQAQIDFVRFLASLKPQLDELKRIAAEAFLPLLTIAIRNLSENAFDTIAVGIGQVATALGEASIKISETITEAENLRDLADLFTISADVIRGFGVIISNVFDSFLSIVSASAPITRDFIGFLESKTGAFAKFLDVKQASGELETFFNRSGEIAAQFGRIFGNIFGGFGAVIGANFAPGSGGDMFLTFLETATQKFADLDSSPAKADKLKQYFIDVSINAQKILSSIGALITEFNTLGANQNIGKTFDILAEGAPNIGKIATAAVEAGPAFADLVVSVTDLFAGFAGDPGFAISFFETLGTIVQTVADVINSDISQSILRVTGPILGFLSAFGFVGGILTIAINVLAGAFGSFLVALTNVKKAFGALKFAGSLVLGFFKLFSIASLKSIAESIILRGMYAKDAIVKGALAIKTGALTVATVAQTAATKLGTIATTVGTGAAKLFGAAMKTSLGPIGLIITIIAALVAGLIYFFTQTELGKEIWANVTQFLSDAFANTVAFLTDALTNISNFFTDTWTNIKTFLSGALEGLVNLFLNWTIYGLIIKNWDAIVVFFQTVWANILAFFATAFENIRITITNVITTVRTIWEAGLTLVGGFFRTIWDNIILFFSGVFTRIRDAVALLIAAVRTVWETGLGIVRDFFSTIWNGIITFFAGIVTNIRGRIDTFVAAFRTVIDFLPKIGDAFRIVFDNVVGFIRGSVNTALGLVEGLVNNVIKAINGIIGGINSVVGVVGRAIGVNLRVPTIPRISLPRLALGGTVFPSAGGSIVNVAEAGRPERIEPLDPDGLSKRDRAIMKLNGVGGGKIEIIVNPPAGTNNAEIARMVSRELSLQMRKGGTR